MLKCSEGFFQSHGMTNLFYQIWYPHNSPKGILVITHGQGEHSDCYHRLVEALQSLDFLIIGWDLRGHGRSDGQRGYVSDFNDYVIDFRTFQKKIIEDLVHKNSGIPLVYFAHSMGCVVQLSALSKIEEGCKATQVLSSPFLGLSLEIPTYKQAAAEILGKFLPRLTLNNEINNNQLTRDFDIQREFEMDSLRHHKISSQAYLGALSFADKIIKQADLWEGKMLILLSDSDPIVSSPLNRRFADSLSAADVRVEVFENRKHELINDLGREEVFRAIREFLSKK